MDAARKAEAEAAAKLKEAEHKLLDVTQRGGRLHEVRVSSATVNRTPEHQPKEASASCLLLCKGLCIYRGLPSFLVRRHSCHVQPYSTQLPPLHSTLHSPLHLRYTQFHLATCYSTPYISPASPLSLSHLRHPPTCPPPAPSVMPRGLSVVAGSLLQGRMTCLNGYLKALGLPSLLWRECCERAWDYQARHELFVQHVEVLTMLPGTDAEAEVKWHQSCPVTVAQDSHTTLLHPAGGCGCGAPVRSGTGGAGGRQAEHSAGAAGKL